MLEYLLHDIEKALQNEMYFIALQSTLTIPDICSALESESGKSNGKLYAKWYDEYIKFDKDYLTGDDCYYYRCACIHQGKSKHEKMQYSRVIFLYPNMSVTMHNNIMNDALNIDINVFCKQMIDGARNWLIKHMNDPIVQRNYEGIMKIHPEGITPYIHGFAVIG